MFKGTLESKVVDTFSPKPMSLKTSKHIKKYLFHQHHSKKIKNPNEYHKNYKRVSLESRWNENITKFSSAIKAALQVPTLGIYATAGKPVTKNLLGEEL